MNPPETTEYGPYFQRYVDLVPKGDFFSLFEQNRDDTLAFFKAIPPEKHLFSYAEGKWTIKDVLMHIIDTERVFSYRAHAIARGNGENLPGMDQNVYAAHVDLTERTLQSLLDEFFHVRNGNLLFFKHLTEEQAQQQGHSPDHVFSARALGYIMIGHVIHHMNVVRERYM